MTSLARGVPVRPARQHRGHGHVVAEAPTDRGDGLPETAQPPEFHGLGGDGHDDAAPSALSDSR